MRGRRNQDKDFVLVNPSGNRPVESGKRSSDAALLFSPLASLDMMLVHFENAVSGPP